MKKTKEQLIAHLDERITNARRNIASFANAAGSDPASAIRSVDTFARDTARLQVAAVMRRALDHDEVGANEVFNEANAQALLCARNLIGGRSTSTGTNLLDAAVAGAWAELVDWMEGR